MSKISVLIPVYNVEPYIRKCLDSVVNQTYKNLEIICINDGSTDYSGEICNEYAQKDSRIRVINKPNGGVSSALNVGLDSFTGEYVGFVDPDDWIERDYYDTAYRIIRQKKVDIVCFAYYRESSEECTLTRNRISIENTRLNTEQILKCAFIRDEYQAFGAYYWNKLFSSGLFKSTGNYGHQLRLCEDLQVGGDILLFAECALKANGAIFCEKAFYHYLQRETSLFHSTDLKKRIGSLVAYSKVIELLENNKIGTEVLIWVKRFYVYHASLLTELAIINNDTESLPNMQKEIRRYLKEYLETNRAYPDRIERINYLLGYQIKGTR